MSKSKPKKFISLAIFLLIPFAYAQWTKTSGPPGGKLRSFVSDGTDMYCASGGGGIHKSTDGGNVWLQTNNGLLSTDAKVLVRKDSMIFVGTDEGVYRSEDEGLTWKAKFNGLRDKYVKSMTVMGDYIFAGTYVNGLYRSNDNGDSWEKVYTPGADYIYIMDNDGTNVYAATYGDGVMVSEDNGDTWEFRNNGLANLGILNIFANDSILLASLAGDLYRSTDKGLNWASVVSGQAKGVVEKDGKLYAGFFGAGMYVSDDQGLTWSARNTGLAEKDIWAVGTDGSVLLAGVGSGNVYRSVNNGASWSLASITPSGGAYVGSLEAVINLPEQPEDSIYNKVIACTHGNTLFNTQNEGDTWTQKTVGTVEIRSITSVGKSVLVGTDMLGIFLSGDGGGTYTAKNNGLGSKWVHSIHITNRLEAELFCGTGEAGIYFTTDAGNNWVAKNNGLTANSVKSIVGGDPEMFVGTGDGGVFYSNDYASSWTERNNGLPTDWIETLLLTDSLLFAGTGDAGVYVSDDKGLNWSPRNNGLNDSLYVRNILEHNGTLIACSKPLGVFISRDYGETWQEFNSGLTNTYIASLDIFDGNIYAGSIGDGVYIRLLSDLEVLGTPVNLTITSGTSSSLLNWDEVIGASYYRIYRSDQPYSGFEEIDISASTSYEDTGASGNKYFYRVTADNSK